MITTAKLDEIGKNHYFKENIEIKKGFIVSQNWLEKNEELLKKYFEFFTVYPDIYLDIIAPDSGFELYFYQRIYLRACMRFRYVYVTAPRGFAKSFLSVLSMYLKCIFQPGIKVFICAPQKGQGVKIATEKMTEILNIWPLLRRELIGEDFRHSTDYMTANFRNGSVFDVVTVLNSQKGGRRNAGEIDEVRRPLRTKKLFNCWKLSLRQSAAKPRNRKVQRLSKAPLMRVE